MGMIVRCTKPSCASFPRYGGKGVKVCDRWRDFKAFYADMGDPGKDLTLDRIDPCGNYEPSNCRWATMKEQQNNRSNTRHLTWDGVTKTLGEWATETDIPLGTIAKRIKLGWSAEKALTKPVRAYASGSS